LRVSILLRNLTCLIAAMFAGQQTSVSAANRDELWFAVDNLCVSAYRHLGVAFPCLEANITNGLERGFAVFQAPLKIP
jgi:CDP-diacylglycerol pyrophosphatase